MSNIRKIKRILNFYFYDRLAQGFNTTDKYGDYSLFFKKKSTTLSLFCLNLVGFLVAFILNKSPFSLLFDLTVLNFF
jgi:hypothetical protein